MTAFARQFRAAADEEPLDLVEAIADDALAQSEIRCEIGRAARLVLLQQPPGDPQGACVEQGPHGLRVGLAMMSRASLAVAAASAARTIESAVDASVVAIADFTTLTVRGLTESLSTPMAANIAAPSGSAAARPHTDTLMPWRFAATTVRSHRASTAGWSGSWSSSSAVLVRSAAIAYCVRSLVPIEKKSHAVPRRRHECH